MIHLLKTSDMFSCKEVCRADLSENLRINLFWAVIVQLQGRINWMQSRWPNRPMMRQCGVYSCEYATKQEPIPATRCFVVLQFR